MNNWRIIVVGVIQNTRDEYLICHKPSCRGVFPGQWGLPGGGIEPSEYMEEALKREIREEVGIEVSDISPLFFTDGLYPKLFPDGSSINTYMIFLMFSCLACSENISINEEFDSYAWVSKEKLKSFDLNEETKRTFIKMEIIC